MKKTIKRRLYSIIGIFIFIEFFLVPFASANSTTYIMNGTDGNTAWKMDNGADTPEDPESVDYTEYTSVEYSAIENDDRNENIWISDDTGDNWVNLWYNFTINEDVENITSIKVLWKGYDELLEADDFEFDIWNFTSSNWEVINTTTEGISFDNANREGMTQNETYFWIVDSTAGDKEVYKYWLNGTYTGDHFDTAASGNVEPHGITQNETFFWITDGFELEVYKYWLNGTYTGDHFDTAASGNGNPAGITQNETYFWIVDVTDLEVYKYWLNGTYTGDHFDTAASGSTDSIGITKNETFFWITDGFELEVYKYWLNGTYTGDHFDTNANTAPYGITQNETYICTDDMSINVIYRYHMNGTYFDNIGLVNDSIYETTFTSASNNLSNFIFNGTLHLAVSGEYSATASCPYVYVWNGTGYYFDSEAITRNVLPEWTGSQLSRLPSLEPIKVHKEMNWLEKIFNIFKLRPIDKDKYIYKLKITEELPENSYIDNVELIKVYHNSNEVYSGLGQNIWTIENKIKPSSVIDDTGKDVLNLIENNDEIYWNNGDYSGTNYEDLNGDNIADSNNPDDLYKYVELTFEKPSDADSVKLNFKALEFEQEASIWANMLRIMDEKGITSRLAIDGTIVNWFGRNAPAMFWIQIWDGNNWNTQTIVQEFPAHKGAEVAYKFDISNVQTDDLKIRFLGMPNEAGLDYVYADYSGDSELKTETIPFTKATFKGNDIMDIVGRIDNNFQRLQPDCGDEILLEFEDDKAEENVTYFLNVTGYYKALSKRNMDISDEEFWKILKKPLYTAKVLVYKFKNNLIHHTLYEDYIEVITSYAEPPPPVAQFNYILVQMVDNNGAIWNVYTNQSDNYMRLGVDEDLAFGSPTYYWDNISSDGGAYGYRYQFQESALSNGLTENCTVYFNFTAFNSTSFEYFNDTALDSVKLWSPDIILNTPVDSSAIDTQYVNLSVDANVTNGGDFTLKFIEGDYFSSTSLLNTTGGTNGTYSYNWSGFASGLHKWCVEVQTNDSEISGMREIDTRTAWTRFYEPWGQNNWTFTYTNYPLILSNETPSNASTGILTVTTLLSINISDPNGDAFDWTIECSTGDNDSGTGETNGTKNCSVSGFSAGTVYYWWVNATDGIWWTNETYHFTTASATTIPPIIPPGGGGGVTSTFGTLKVSLKGESVDIEIYRGTTLLYAKSNMAKDTSYTWSSLSAGTYKIRAEGVTSGTIKEQTVTITSGKTTEVIIDMKPSGTPGFEAVIFFLSIAICTFLLNRKRYKKWK